MKYIVLCGGSGKRLETTNGFPKPFNMVLGVHSIQRVLESIPSNEIYVFLNKDLREIHAHTLLPHLVKKTFHCVYLNRYTRGAAETAFVGLQQTDISPEEPLCFFDNDTVYGACSIPETNAIGFMHTTETRPYCYIRTEEGRVLDIAEKIKISDSYAAGIYSFHSRNVFETYARMLLRGETTFNNEYYMSLLYRSMIEHGETITAFPVDSSICLGTPEDIEANITQLTTHKLRICFDIDNTLFEYRKPTETYANCKPIEHMVEFVRQLHEHGHTIILYTARGMKTYKSNVGEVIRHNAMDTISRLEECKVPYDELYFGKPHADLYIDDRAFNPYMNLFHATGFTHLNSSSSGSASNKFNTIVRSGDIIIKRGPEHSMAGEVFFYKAISQTPLSSLFPTFLEGEPGMLRLRFVEGCTLFELLRDKLLTPTHVRKMMCELQRMHSFEGLPVTITPDMVYGNYMGKLKKRVQNRIDYPFENTNNILSILDSRMNVYQPTIVPIVHGDAWFSNTILTKQGDIVFLDMKGDINGTLTTNGDALTDYGKLYQSLIGFDCILNNISVDEDYMETLRSVFFEYLPFSRKDLYTVTACLVAKTISFLHEDVNPKIRYEIWNLVEKCLQNE